MKDISENQIRSCNHSRRIIIFALLMLVITALLAANGVALADNGQAPAAEPAFQATSGCVEGHKIDDLHVGLPGWVIRARPAGQNSPMLIATTNGTGYFRFDDMAVGTWTFWEEQQAGWSPVTLPQFDADVIPGPECIYIRFKNRQSTPTPTPTPTVTPTAIPAVRIRGYVYKETCDGLVPVRDVALRVYRSDSELNPETQLQERTTDGSGFWNFYLPTALPPYYHVTLIAPPGLEAESANAPLGFVLAPDHIRFDAPIYRVYGDNAFILRDPNLDCEQTPTPTVTVTTTPGPPVCVEGHKIDDYHIGLPLWEIHARPVGLGQPELITFTDGLGQFRFDNLTPGNWTFWEIMQDGWEPVTAPMFDVTVKQSQFCTYIRFKNRQTRPTATATPTSTPSPTVTPTPTEGPSPTPTTTLPPGVTLTATPTPTTTPRPATSTPTVTPFTVRHRLFLPMILHESGQPWCAEGRLEVTVHGTAYSFSLIPDGNIKSVRPLAWNVPTAFRIVGYDGPVTWTLYRPFYNKQIGGDTYIFPGGYAGERFSLFVDTDCGIINVHTEIDDPTPTPSVISQ